MTTDTVTPQGDAPPRHLASRWRRRHRYESAIRQDAMTHLARAVDLATAAAKRRQRTGDEQAVRHLATRIAHLAEDLDRRPA